MNKEAVGVTTACLALIGSAVFTGEWLWAGFMGALVAVLGVFELVGVKINGKTLTNRFRDMQVKNKVTLSSGILGFIGWLMYHLWFE